MIILMRDLIFSGYTLNNHSLPMTAERLYSVTWIASVTSSQSRDPRFWGASKLMTTQH